MYHQADNTGRVCLSASNKADLVAFRVSSECGLSMGDPSGTCGLPCRYKVLLYTTAEMVERRWKLIACYTVLWLNIGTLSGRL